MENRPINPLGYGKPDPGRRVRRRTMLRAIAGLLGVSGIGAVYEYLRWNPDEVHREPKPARTMTAAKPPAAAVEPVETVYHDSIVPLLEDFNRRNAAAADRGVAALHDRISMHRAGVAAFTRDVVSWHTRFGVLKRYPGDVWRKLRGTASGPTAVSEYVNDKFRRHIVNEQSLQNDVTLVLAGFDRDMAASRNLLYSQLALPLARIRTSHPAMAPKLERFDRDVQNTASRMTRSLAPDTLVAGLAAIAGGWVATDVTQALTTRIVAQILTRVGTAMAAEGIEAGGATVGGAAAGGGTGSLGGPLGTIIGIGVGLVIGAIVDWRLSKRFEARVTDQCMLFLQRLEQRLRDGTPQSPGLNVLLHETAALSLRIQRDAIRNALKEAQK